MPRLSYLSQLAHPVSSAIPLRPPNALVRRWAQLESLRLADGVPALSTPADQSLSAEGANIPMGALDGDVAPPARSLSAPSAPAAPSPSAAPLDPPPGIPAFEPMPGLAYSPPRPIPSMRPADVAPAPTAVSRTQETIATLPPSPPAPSAPVLAAPPPATPIAAPDHATATPNRGPAPPQPAILQPPERTATSPAGPRPLAPQELLPAVRPSSPPRALGQERRAMVHIGTVDVCITPPAEDHAPARPQAPAGRPAAPASPLAPLSRGFTSVFGLRQG